MCYDIKEFSMQADRDLDGIIIWGNQVHQMHYIMEGFFFHISLAEI